MMTHAATDTTASVIVASVCVYRMVLVSLIATGSVQGSA
jgi:molybdopterin biosynthesis enzyme